MMSAHTYATRARALLELQNTRDLDGIDTLVTEDVEFIYTPTGEVFHGREGCRQFTQFWLTAFPDAVVEAVNEVAAGEWEIVECIGRGTNTGPLPGPLVQSTPTGRTIEVRFCWVAHLRDGQIDHLRDYQDHATMMQQLGLASLARETGA
jgi:ketosteroid isomerase-like protein